MKRTLQLRRETLTELSPEELDLVVGGAPTTPLRQCLIDAAAIATFLSLCITCLVCTVEAPDAS